MSGFLDTPTILELRRLAEGSMRSIATVTMLSPEMVEVSPGRYEQVPVVLYEAKKCSLAPAADPREAITADSIQALSKLLVKFPAGTMIPEDAEMSIIPNIDGVPSPLVVKVEGVRIKTNEITRHVFVTLVKPGG